MPVIEQKTTNKNKVDFDLNRLDKSKTTIFSKYPNYHRSLCTFCRFMICIPDCITGRAEGTTRGLKLSKIASGHDTLREEDRAKRLCRNGLQQIVGNCSRDFLALITQRSEGQVLPPQPDKVCDGCTVSVKPPRV